MEEKRLIDANGVERKLKIAISSWLCDCNSNAPVIARAMEDALSRVIYAPTVDAVEVVRCRECKFGTHFGDMEDEWINCTNLHGKPLMPFDGFCSYGERKDGVVNG